MPLLASIFSRKNKASPRSKRDDQTDSIHSGTAASELESTLSSPTTSSYGSPSKSLPSHPSSMGYLHPDSARDRQPASIIHAPPLPPTPSPSSGSRLRLAFSRKKSNISNNNETRTENFNTSPRPALPTRASADDPGDLRRLRPPPSRSAIFAAYGDPNSALSTRSLPNDPALTASNSPNGSSQPPHKRPSLFPWAKQQPSTPSSSPSRHNESLSTSKSTQDSSSALSSPEPSQSFNLKSFRHIRPPSPSNGSNVSLAPPIPRPRGESTNSDSSQRISVAAFREAQSRRSLAGSPSPSFRSPSPLPGLPQQRGMSPDEPLGGGGRGSPRPSRSHPSIPTAARQERRRSSMALAYTSESESPDSSSEDESGDETVQQRSGTRPSFDRPGRVDKARAKSEIGHGHMPHVTSRSTEFPVPRRAAPKSHVGHSYSPSPSSQKESNIQSERKNPEVPPRSQSSLSHYAGGIRPRASASTSALSPSAAAKRASILAESNSNMSNYPAQGNGVAPVQTRKASQPPAPTSRVGNGNSSAAPRKNSRVSSDSDSEDDAPLASLVGPRRPGSAMSSYSNLHSRSTGNVTTRSNTHTPLKPLIDINELTAPKRSFTAPDKNTPGFTEGPTLLSLGKLSPYTPSPLVESPVSTSGWRPTSDDNLPLTRKDPPVNFISPPDSPAKELDQFIGKNEQQGIQGRKVASPVSRTPETSPEPRRDHITDRLTKVVQKNLSSPPTGTTQWAQSSIPARKPVVEQNSQGSDDDDSASDTSQAEQKVKQVASTSPPLSRKPLNMTRVPSKAFSKDEHSPVDQELAQMLGSAGIALISRNGESSEESTDSESDEDENENGTVEDAVIKDRIAPIPIKQRSPPPAFSVTSRPPLHRPSNGTNSPGVSPFSSEEKNKSMDYTPRPRSTTLTNTPSATAYAPRKSFTSDLGATQSNAVQTKSERASPPQPPAVRQRSSTMLTGVPLASQMPKTFNAPEKPFAVRRNSPASSTGDSSSGRAPLTPRDGSDSGVQEENKPKGHVKRRSVSFEDDLQDLKPPSRNHFKESTKSGSDAGDTSNDEDRVEYRRRERRRTEAKAAIELGNVINGRGPIVDDDEDDMPINQTMNARMSTLNPAMAMGNPMQMAFGGMSNSAAWGANMGQPMLSPAQFMVPPPADPNFIAAHQQAMLIAKQAYQMAVAQQAMAAAADEWERGSTVGGLGGGSVYGGGSIYGGGSVYGGSAVPSMMSPQFNMMNMLQPSGWPSSASVYGGARSMYGGSIGPGDGMMSGSRSEYGGASGRNGGGNWNSSRSSYGDSFGPSTDQYGRGGQQGQMSRRPGNQPRDSGYFPPVPPMPASQSANGRSSPDMRANPRSRTASQPANPNRGPAPRKAAPPSSWKAGT